MSRVAGTRNLVPRVLSYPPFSRSAGWVGENPGNEVGGPAPWKAGLEVGWKGRKRMLVPIISLSCFSLVSRARVFPNPHLWRRQILRPVCRGARLSTSCSRFSKKCPVISQKVAQKLLKKKQSKVALCINESCSKVAQKNKNEFWSDAKKCNLYNKSKISKHFCAILWRNQRC